MDITLWVVSYGSDVSSTTNTRLQQCATPGKFFQYTPGVSLTSQFKQIAGQIAALKAGKHVICEKPLATTLAAAEEMVKLAKERQASQLGVVLEYLLAREELTRARQSRVQAVTEFNKAQHELKRAVGK